MCRENGSEACLKVKVLACTYTPLYSEDSKISTLTNSKDSDKMPHNASFHKGLLCLLRPKQSSEKETQFYLEIMTCEHTIYIMDQDKPEGKIHEYSKTCLMGSAGRPVPV